MRLAIQTACFIAGVSAFQFPFKVKVPFFNTQLQEILEEPVGPARVAIIGAGAAGSSAAFWISKAKERFGVDVEVDIYEKSDYVGGRSTTVFPLNDSSLPPMELGASIFVSANWNMQRATDEFGLNRTLLRDEKFETGIWDGEQLIISMADSWWDTLKVLWRYGMAAPTRMENRVTEMLKKFMTLYDYRTPKWDNVTDLAEKMEWTGMTSQTTYDYFRSKDVASLYLEEIVDGATRVNYGQNVDEIHALEGACSMAASQAASVEGGNFQIFENFVKRSNATLYLDTPVLSIEPKSSNSHDWRLTSSRGTTDYRAVILAAPFHSTGIKIDEQHLISPVPPQPYVHLHVTLLTTTAPHIRPEYLNMKPDEKPPRFLLTTSRGFKQGGKAPEFNSLSYHKQVIDEPGKEQWTVKIFSKQELTDEWLANVFGEGTVTWVYRKVWDAYPKLPPTTTFPPVKLATGLYYVNSMEPFISTMETEIISSRNTVDLLLNEKFSTSICGATIDADARDKKRRERTLTMHEIYTGQEQVEDYIYGWDC